MLNLAPAGIIVAKHKYGARPFLNTRCSLSEDFVVIPMFDKLLSGLCARNMSHPRAPAKNQHDAENASSDNDNHPSTTTVPLCPPVSLKPSIPGHEVLVCACG